MPLVSGQGTTYNLPNYRGELYQITPTDTPFLSAIGGLDANETGTTSTEFEWQVVDHKSASQPAVLEGATAPTATNRSRAAVANVVQIFHYSFDMSYTKLAAQGQFAGANNAQAGIMDDLAFQQSIKLEEAAMDMEYSLLKGYYLKPSDNATARQTRGLLRVPTTNVRAMSGSFVSCTATASTDKIAAVGHGLSNGDKVQLRGTGKLAGLDDDVTYYVVSTATDDFKLALTSGGSAVDITANISSGLTYAKLTALTKVGVLNMLQGVWGTNRIKAEYEPTLVVNATAKRALTKLFITDANYREQTRNVGGVAVTQIETDFGRINIMLNAIMPEATVLFTHLRMCQPVFLQIPGKGFLFTEPLAKTGASEKAQLYGECGLKYGPETAHGLLLGADEVSGA